MATRKNTVAPQKAPADRIAKAAAHAKGVQDSAMAKHKAAVAGGKAKVAALLKAIKGPVLKAAAKRAVQAQADNNMVKVVGKPNAGNSSMDVQWAADKPKKSIPISKAPAGTKAAAKAGKTTGGMAIGAKKSEVKIGKTTGENISTVLELRIAVGKYPDASKVLIMGDEVRIYNRLGRLVHTIKHA